MIVSQGKYPLDGIVTIMSDGDVQFTISTAKEGLLEGLTTCVQLPTGNLTAKIFYMPAMKNPAIHVIHGKLVESIEENLDAGGHLALILHDLLLSLRESQYTQDVVIDSNFTDFVLGLRRNDGTPPDKNGCGAKSKEDDPKYDEPIPPDRLGGLIPAMALFAKEANSPEKFAASITQLGPKAPNFTQSLWFFAKGVGVVGPDRPDWPKIYAELRAGEALESSKLAESESEAPTWSPFDDHWFLVRLKWMRENQPEHLRHLARNPEDLVETVFETVQQARRAWQKCRGQGMDKQDSTEIVWSEILTPVLDDEDAQEMVIDDNEWEEILAALKSV